MKQHTTAAICRTLTGEVHALDFSGRSFPKKYQTMISDVYQYMGEPCRVLPVVCLALKGQL